MLLLEREAQLASLDDYAAEARAGEGRLILIAGEAGRRQVGAGRARAASALPAATWYWGACDGLFTPRPLGPLFDIAGTLGGELLELCRSAAPRDELFSALLRQVSCAPGTSCTSWSSRTSTGPTRPPSTCCASSAGGSGTSRSLLLATYRDEGLTATDPLRVALGDLATQRPVRRMSLPPLSRGRGRGAGRRQRPRSRRALPADRRQPVLRQPGGRRPGRATSRPPPGTRCWPRPPGSARTRARMLDAAALIGARVELALLEHGRRLPAVGHR